MIVNDFPNHVAAKRLSVTSQDFIPEATLCASLSTNKGTEFWILKFLDPNSDPEEVGTNHAASTAMSQDINPSNELQTAPQAVHQIRFVKFPRRDVAQALKYFRHLSSTMLHGQALC